ncbi:IucC family-domain-containing protein [Geopyxis carbonaria]|nr:IucC family-domain-containing protein [Geopyxis carbonaria]
MSTLTATVTEVPHPKFLDAVISGKIELPECVEVAELTLTQQACFETTRRLLACLVNEELVQATVQSFNNTQWLCIHDKPQKQHRLRLYVPLSGPVDIRNLLDPEDLLPPVVIEEVNESNRIELDPGVIFKLVYPWFGDDKKIGENITQELESSAELQEKWFEIFKDVKLPDLDSPSIEWENAMIRGHPYHPMHRTCMAQPPLAPIGPEDLPSILNPSISFLSVRRSDICLSGEFELTIAPLLTALSVPVPSDKTLTVVPCLTRQLPSIYQRFPHVTVLPSDVLTARAQSSLRTVTLPEALRFPYHIKFPLACEIMSGVRTIAPWTTASSPELSQLLNELLPPQIWAYNEPAGMVGSLEDPNEARHFSCLIRDSLEERAAYQNEALVVAAALCEHPVSSLTSHAERIFGLHTLAAKQSWFRSYTHALLSATLPPLVQHGICLEAHGQNIAVRVDRATRKIVGFAVRDIGGIRVHRPTIGRDLKSAMPGSNTMTDDRGEVWAQAHHTLIQNHLNQFVRALGLQNAGGWGIVRDVIRKVLGAEGTEGELRAFLERDTVPYRSFIKMKMAGLYRNYLYQQRPNVLSTP